MVGEYYYTYTNGNWVQTGEVPDLGDFAVIVVLKGTYGGMNFYWWNDKWQMVNMDEAGSLEDRVAIIEDYTLNNKIVYSYDPAKNYKLAIVPDSYTDAQIEAAITPDPNNEIVILTTINSLPSTDIVVNVGN